MKEWCSLQTNGTGDGKTRKEKSLGGLDKWRCIRKKKVLFSLLCVTKFTEKKLSFPFLVDGELSIVNWLIALLLCPSKSGQIEFGCHSERTHTALHITEKTFMLVLMMVLVHPVHHILPKRCSRLDTWQLHFNLNEIVLACLLVRHWKRLLEQHSKYKDTLHRHWTVQNCFFK